MVRVAVYGASGYTGLELLRLLASHPHAQVTALATRQEDEPHIAEVHPSLTGVYDLRLERLSPEQMADRAEVVFACLPHGASAEVVAPLVDMSLKVVDLSADYRLTDRDVYGRWYGVTHPDPGRLGQVPYGLPELYRSRIAESPLVANPGCYPTAVVLGLAPLLIDSVIENTMIHIDAKSGVTGAGRKPKPNLHFPECNESCTAYGVGTHRHTPEIEQVLSDAWGRNRIGADGAVAGVVFTPHLVPMDRGELCTCYAAPHGDVTAQTLHDCLREFYAEEPFVEVVDAPPATKDVAGTNRCHVFATRVNDWAVVISAIDNLIKGASGAAVQNMNLMCGFEEAAGLKP